MDLTESSRVPGLHRQPFEGRGRQRSRLRLCGSPYGRHWRTFHHRCFSGRVGGTHAQCRREERLRWHRRSTAEQGARVGSYADGVIVGSALVHTMLDESGKNAVDEATGLKALAAKAEELADGVHNARVAK